MDRKAFLCRSLPVLAGVGLGCPCVSGADQKPQAPVPEGAAAPGYPGATSFEKRTDFGNKWIGRFMRVVDERLDERTRRELMEANGRACAVAAYGPVDTSKTMPLDAFVATLAKHLGEENARREGDVVYFGYKQHAQGPQMADGHCFCKLVEDGPADLSPTYCSCSAGHVAYLFEKNVGRPPARVEVLESVRRGGKACRFAVHA